MRMFRNKQQIFNCLDLWLNIFDIFTFFICLILFEAATKNPCYFCPYSFCYELSFLCFFPFDNSMCHWIDLLDLWVFAWTLFLFLLFYSIPFIPISTTLPSPETNFWTTKGWKSYKVYGIFNNKNEYSTKCITGQTFQFIFKYKRTTTILINKIETSKRQKQLAIDGNS